MVVAVQPTASSPFQLAELISNDGLAWTESSMLAFTADGANYFDPAMSSDGCLPLFVREDAAGRQQGFGSTARD